MLKKKLQDLSIYLSYNFACLHPKEHSGKQFRKQYRLGEEIGRGGFGIVYKAHRVEDGLPVAVKFIERRHVRSWTMWNGHLIPTEICHLELCNDIPGVVRLIDWFTSTKGFLIVMERPEKFMDLFDVLSAYGRLDEPTARRIFVQVVDTVLQMYTEHSLIHRDIKDENVILDMQTGDVKLCDFGAADFLESANKKTFQGTKSYCPPEVFKRHKYLPLESTVWSLGVLLYILLVGANPFKNEICVVLGKLNFPPYISPECQTLIKRCLCISPDRRATLAEVRSHPWMTVPLEVYSQSFHTILRKRSVKRKTRRRRGRSAIDFSSDEEDETEDTSTANLARFPETNGAISVPLAIVNSTSVVETINSEPIDVPVETATTMEVKQEPKISPVSRCESCYENIPIYSERIMPNPLRKESLEIYHSVCSSLTGYESATSTHSISEPIDDEMQTSIHSSSQSSAPYFSARESLSEGDFEQLTVDVRESEDGSRTPYPPSVHTLCLREPSVESEDTNTEATMAVPRSPKSLEPPSMSDTDDEMTVYENYPKIQKRYSSRRSHMERKIKSRKEAVPRSASLRLQPHERVNLIVGDDLKNRRSFRGVKSYEALADASMMAIDLLEKLTRPLPKLETRRTSNGYQLIGNEAIAKTTIPDGNEVRPTTPSQKENQDQEGKKITPVKKCPTSCSNNSFNSESSRYYSLAVFDVNAIPVGPMPS